MAPTAQGPPKPKYFCRICNKITGLVHEKRAFLGVFLRILKIHAQKIRATYNPRSLFLEGAFLMISVAIESLVVNHSSAHFAGTQGYSLDGDQAHLNAAVALDDVAQAGADWALQLWACDQGAGQGGLQGIKVAELPVGCLPAPGATSLDGWATALPPAGQRAHTMVLALASGYQGFFDRIHDLTVFPNLESFRQPSLQGVVAYRFEPGWVELKVDAVTNPRDAGNLSGSLILELWALPRAYQGGAFEGFHVATAELGCLAGQGRIEGLQVTVPAALVPAGTWQIALMLREWTPAGNVTRDYANFAEPLVVAEVVAEPAPVAPAVVIEAAAPAVVAASAPAASKADPVPAQAAQPVVEKRAAEAAPARVELAQAVTPPAPAKPAEAVKAPAAAAAVKPAAPVTAKAVEPVQAKAAAATQAAAPAAAEPDRVSINRATAAQLAAIKGLSKSIAAAIVAARPYASVDDVVRAKGMGAKLLGKLRDQLSL
jgi:DNA uptake protein ComE-like DNA-binding protein